MAKETPGTPDGDSRAARHRAIWRWHFYAGLFVAPVVLILSITGGLYLFQQEISRWWNSDVAIIAPGDAALSLPAQEAVVLAAHPGAKIRAVALPDSADEASIWSLESRGAARDVYVDPYRGVITGERNPASQPMTIVRKLHGTLLAGDWGSYLVELVACWTLLMLVTGVYLWWPSQWRIRGVWWPRAGAPGRLRWRDLHAVPAALNAVVVGFLILSGLPWSAFWGSQFANLGTVVPWVAASPNFKAPPTLAQRVEDPHAEHQPQESLPWPVQQLTPPTSFNGGNLGVEVAERQVAAMSLIGRPGVRVFYPASMQGVYTVSYVPARAQGQRTLYIDPGSGAVLDDIDWTDYSPAAKAVEWGVMAHMGKQFGPVNQIFNLVVVLVLCATVILGVYLWWTRRPSGSFGVPMTRAGDKLPVALKACLLVLAVVFPLVGASILVLLAGQYVAGLARRKA